MVVEIVFSLSVLSLVCLSRLGLGGDACLTITFDESAFEDDPAKSPSFLELLLSGFLMEL